MTTKVPQMVEEAFEYIEDVTTTVTERVKTVVKTSGMSAAWAVAGVRNEIEKAAKALVGFLPSEATVKRGAQIAAGTAVIAGVALTTILDNNLFGVLQSRDAFPDHPLVETGIAYGDGVSAGLAVAETTIGAGLTGTGLSLAPAAAMAGPATAGVSVAVDGGAVTVGGIMALHGMGVLTYTAGKDRGGETTGTGSQTIANSPQKAPASAFEKLEPVSNQNKNQIRELTEKMKSYGWQGNPISVFEYNGSKYVLDGHHRVAAARDAGVEIPYLSVPADQLAQFGYQKIDEVIWAAAQASGR